MGLRFHCGCAHSLVPGEHSSSGSLCAGGSTMVMLADDGLVAKAVSSASSSGRNGETDG